MPCQCGGGRLAFYFIDACNCRSPLIKASLSEYPVFSSDGVCIRMTFVERSWHLQWAREGIQIAVIGRKAEVEALGSVSKRPKGWTQ